MFDDVLIYWLIECAACRHSSSPSYRRFKKSSCGHHRIVADYLKRNLEVTGYRESGSFISIACRQSCVLAYLGIVHIISVKVACGRQKLLCCQPCLLGSKYCIMH